MARVCTTITEWIQTEISKPIEEWEERSKQECRKRPWYDPRRWLCTIVRWFVLVVRWVVVTVVTAVITVVCRLISEILGVVWNVLQFFGNLLKAIFTWDKCALQEALAELLDAIAAVLTLIGTVVIRPIIDRVQTYRLRRYVKHQVAQRYVMEPDVIPRLWATFNVDTGVFGYRVTCDLYRMYVDSLTLTDRFGDVPNLFALHDAGLVDLYQLAGFDAGCALFSEAGWYRPRHLAVTLPEGEQTTPPPKLTRDQLTEYIDSRGTAGPHFRIYAISPSNIGMRRTTAEEYGRQLGLILTFDNKAIEVTHERYINYSEGVQTDFLIQELRRTDKKVDPVAAGMELCSPVAVAVFGFSDGSLRGLTDNLIGTSCPARNLPASDTSGVSFIDDIPDAIRRFVLIHELGHYYGLCHVDGFDRIMVSGKPGQGDIFTWKAIGNAFVHGGPRFIYTEAQRAWDFIIDNFPHGCLAPDGDVIL